MWIICHIVLFIFTGTLATELPHQNNNVDALSLRVQRLEKRDHLYQIRLKNLEQENKIHQIEIEDLHKRDDYLTNQNNWLQERDQLQLNQIQRLQERDEQQQNNIQHLKECFELQQSQIRHFEEKEDNKQDKIKTLEDQDDNTDETIKLNGEPKQSQHITKRGGMISNEKKRAEENDTPIAFFASLINHQRSNGVGQTVIFDKVITNIGNAYHDHVGTFIAPVSGIYVFSATLMSWNTDVTYNVVKNSATISQIYVHSANSAHDDTGSQTFILQLNANDDITIRHGNSVKSTHNLSSFAGFLLQQYDPAVIVG